MNNFHERFMNNSSNFPRVEDKHRKGRKTLFACAGAYAYYIV